MQLAAYYGFGVFGQILHLQVILHRSEKDFFSLHYNQCMQMRVLSLRLRSSLSSHEDIEQDIVLIKGQKQSFENGKKIAYFQSSIQYTDVKP